MSAAGRSDVGELVGRGQELERLLALVDDARGGRGRAALLLGEAGIGKTRLAEAFAAADACNIMQIDPFGGGLLSPELAVLRSHCEDLGRPFETVLRTYATGWTILAKDEAALSAKLAHYFPDGIEQRYQGAWRDYVFHATPDRAIAHFRALIEAGIQSVIVETMDAMDHETMRLLATDVIPAIAMAGSQRG